jgi:hypothetical protein
VFLRLTSFMLYDCCKEVELSFLDTLFCKLDIFNVLLRERSFSSVVLVSDMKLFLRMIRGLLLVALDTDVSVFFAEDVVINPYRLEVDKDKGSYYSC